VLRSDKPPYLAKFFLVRSDHLPPRGDRARTLVIPKSHTDFLRKSFHVSTSTLWTSLPLSIIHSPSLFTFKNRLHNHLFTFKST